MDSKQPLFMGIRPKVKKTAPFQAFHNGEMDILVATDVAARGIDIPTAGLVIKYDLPNVAESYVHRIGRTARAGRSGKAISFYTSDERQYLDAIEKLIKMRIKTIGDVPQTAAGDKKSLPKRRKGSKKKRIHQWDKVKNSEKQRNGQRHRGGKFRTNQTVA